MGTFVHLHALRSTIPGYTQAYRGDGGLGKESV